MFLVKILTKVVVQVARYYQHLAWFVESVSLHDMVVLATVGFMKVEEVLLLF